MRISDGQAPCAPTGVCPGTTSYMLLTAGVLALSGISCAPAAMMKAVDAPDISKG